MQKIHNNKPGLMLYKLALLSVFFFIPAISTAKSDSLSYRDLVQLGLPAVKKHLAQQADINQRDAFGDTLLVQAAISNSPEIAHLLIIKDADINLASQSKHKNGYTPLMAAVESGNDEIINLLLNKNIEINAMTSKTAWRPGFTALMHASLLGKTKIAKLLIDHGAAHEHQSSYGQNALMLAATYGHTEIITLLLESGIDINAVSKIYVNKGNTALHYAIQAKNNRYKSIKILLSADADAMIKNTQGKTAYYLAIESDNTEIKSLFNEHLKNDK